MAKKRIVLTEFSLPIKHGKKSMDLIFKEDEVFRENNYDYQKMYEDGLITEKYFIREILENDFRYFKDEHFKDLKVLHKSENPKNKIIYNEEDYDYYVVDKKKKYKNNADRFTKKYEIWRDKVFKRDKYTCQHCGKRGKLNAHHIKSYKEFPELRTVVSNGITLCESCHKEEHKRLRGIKNG